jgi:hypothetical protein
VRISKRLEIRAGKKLDTCSLNVKLPRISSIQSGKKTTMTVPIKAPVMLRIPPRTAAVSKVSESETG